MAAARGKKKVGDSWWTLYSCLYSACEDPAGDGMFDNGLNCAARADSRDKAPDIAPRICLVCLHVEAAHTGSTVMPRQFDGRDAGAGSTVEPPELL